FTRRVAAITASSCFSSLHQGKRSRGLTFAANGRILGQTINASRVRGHGQRVLSKIEAPHFFPCESLDTLEGIAVPREHDPNKQQGAHTSIPWKAKQNHGTSKNKIGGTSFEVRPPRTQLG